LTEILLITPPFTQLNTPYPATAYLKGFLNYKNVNSVQADLGLEVILDLFSKTGLQKAFDFAFNSKSISDKNSKKIYNNKERYLRVIEDLVSFLQGNRMSITDKICSRRYLPEASRFNQLEDMSLAFDETDSAGFAKYMATLCLEDLSDFIVNCVDSDFGFSRYAEKIGRSANSFDDLSDRLSGTKSYIDEISLRILNEKINSEKPEIICFSVPFPGNLYSAFRCAQMIKSKYPGIKTIMGGGFPNTELRSVSDSRVFDYFDFICLDDGELPLELIYNHLKNPCPPDSVKLKRTFLRENGSVFYNNLSEKSDYPLTETGCPDYSGLLPDKYISVTETANPMHSLWSDGRWNKLTMAHGCYWGKCSFCDTSLSYIKHYKPVPAKMLADRMEILISQTGETGFHFVDEAAPPNLMRDLAIEIIKRKLQVTWWTNVRFEKNFSFSLCQLLRRSGCIAVAGGLEVASDRLLERINKGVTVEQVAQVTSNFTDAGIMVHAYLMYAFPGQTVQETVDSLEMVRQLFELDLIQSGFWHQFALTTHSEVGRNPEKYGIVTYKKEITFADNDVEFVDSTGIDHSKFSFGLKKSLFNFMHGTGFDLKLQEWFNFKIPETTIKPDYISKCVESSDRFQVNPKAWIVWIGDMPDVEYQSRIKRGKVLQTVKMSFSNEFEDFAISVEKETGEWLLDLLHKASVFIEKQISYQAAKADFESRFSDFELFWFSGPVSKLRENGLLLL